MERLRFFNRLTMVQFGGRYIRPFFCSLLYCQAGFALTPESLNFEIDSFSMNESTSLHSISGNWDRPVDSGDTGLSVSRILLGYHTSSYSLEWVRRFDIYYQYATETADLLYQTENQVPLPAGKDYPLYINAKRSSSHGFRLGSQWIVSERLVIGGNISLLKPDGMVQGSLTGEAQVLSDSDYDFVFNSNMTYNKDPLYSRPGETLDGDGYAVDVNVDYHLNDRWQLDISLLDVVGYLDIPNAPYTKATASSDTKHYDNNGYVIYDPVISGQEGYRDDRFKFDMQTHVNLSCQLDEVNSLSMQYHQLPHYKYHQVEWVINHDENKYGLIVIDEPAAFGFNLETGLINIVFLSDQFNLNKSKIVKINLQFICPFK